MDMILELGLIGMIKEKKYSTPKRWLQIVKECPLSTLQHQIQTLYQEKNIKCSIKYYKR